ncbi:hypothetical protein C8R47DRAFT_1193851 [Mycena vitilis]|nr:hypothetical protein C8R47DRAFT_1193851 [Mycena vitilis]
MRQPSNPTYTNMVTTNGVPAAPVSKVSGRERNLVLAVAEYTASSLHFVRNAPDGNVRGLTIGHTDAGMEEGCIAPPFCEKLQKLQCTRGCNPHRPCSEAETGTISRGEKCIMPDTSPRAGRVRSVAPVAWALTQLVQVVAKDSGGMSGGCIGNAAAAISPSTVPLSERRSAEGRPWRRGSTSQGRTQPLSRAPRTHSSRSAGIAGVGADGSRADPASTPWRRRGGLRRERRKERNKGWKVEGVGNGRLNLSYAAMGRGDEMGKRKKDSDVASWHHAGHAVRTARTPGIVTAR